MEEWAGCRSILVWGPRGCLGEDEEVGASDCLEPFVTMDFVRLKRFMRKGGERKEKKRKERKEGGRRAMVSVRRERLESCPTGEQGTHNQNTARTRGNFPTCHPMWLRQSQILHKSLSSTISPTLHPVPYFHRSDSSHLSLDRQYLSPLLPCNFILDPYFWIPLNNSLCRRIKKCISRSTTLSYVVSTIQSSGQNRIA